MQLHKISVRNLHNPLRRVLIVIKPLRFAQRTVSCVYTLQKTRSRQLSAVFYTVRGPAYRDVGLLGDHRRQAERGRMREPRHYPSCMHALDGALLSAHRRRTHSLIMCLFNSLRRGKGTSRPLTTILRVSTTKSTSNTFGFCFPLALYRVQSRHHVDCVIWCFWRAHAQSLGFQ